MSYLTGGDEAIGVRPGVLLGKYEVVEQIGVGGTSIVWKGYDRLLDRHVAIKQITVAGDDAEVREAFLQEAQAQKKVAGSEPRLVRIIELLDEPRGLFIISELVAGGSLEDRLAKGEPFDPRTALGIAAACASGLAAIHKRQMLHRDIKPSNILFTQDGDVKLCDFGLATSVIDQQALSTGSVRYMAPELLRGEEADGRADLYALGVMTYEMLAGRSRFNEVFKIVMRDERNQAIRWMKWHTNLRVRAQPLSQVRPEVGESLSELVARMMEKDPDQRVASAEELLDAIRRHFTAAASVRGAGGGAQAVGDVAPTAPLPKKSKLPWILTGAAMLWLLMGALIVLDRSQQREQTEAELRAAAQAEFREAETAYTEGRYQAARDQFREIAGEWKQDPSLGAAANARSLLAQAQLDIAAESWETAEQALMEVEQIEVAGRPAVQRSFVLDLLDQVRAKIAFTNELDRIQALIDDGEFVAARQRIIQLRRSPLTAGEEQAINTLAVQIQSVQADVAIAQVREEVAGLLDADRLGAAVTVLDDAIERFPEVEDFRAQRASLQRRIRIEEATRAAQRADASGRRNEAIRAYERLLSLDRDNAQAKRRINELKAEQAYEEGRRALASNDTSAAIARFREAIDLADLPAAKQEMRRLESEAARLDLIRAGDSAMARNDYAEAIRQYDAALDMARDGRVLARRDEARIQLELIRAREAMRRDDLDAARAAFRAVQRLSPDNAEAASGMRRIENLTHYRNLVAEGDAARELGRFAEAKRAYLAAREVYATDELVDKLNRTEFESALRRARQHIDEQAWQAAWGMISLAERLDDSDELQRLKAEVAPHVQQPQ